MGKLEVTILKARNLPDEQLVSKPDPYVKVTCGIESYKTGNCDNSVNPNWEGKNSTFKFHVADESSAQVLFEVWNANTVADDFMGSYKLSLSGMTANVPKEDWYLLQQCKTNAEIQVRLLADFGQLFQPPQLPAEPCLARPDPMHRPQCGGALRPPHHIGGHPDKHGKHDKPGSKDERKKKREECRAEGLRRKQEKQAKKQAKKQALQAAGNWPPGGDKKAWRQKRKEQREKRHKRKERMEEKQRRRKQRPDSDSSSSSDWSSSSSDDYSSSDSSDSD